MRHVPDRPFIDDVCFSDLFFVESEQLRAALVGRRLVYATEFIHAGRTLTGDLIALSWEQAEQLAAVRGLGEAVVGHMGMVAPAPEGLQ